MFNLPNEILNIIFSYVERPQTNKIMKYIIEKGFKEDGNPDCQTHIDNNKNYTFYNWYFSTFIFILFQKTIQNANYKKCCKQYYTHMPEAINLEDAQFHRTLIINDFD
jgi:hypothetical protein